MGEQLPKFQNGRRIRARFRHHEIVFLIGQWCECETGAPSEYATIEETFSPTALKVIGDWILQQTGEE